VYNIGGKEFDRTQKSVERIKVANLDLGAWEVQAPMPLLTANFTLVNLQEESIVNKFLMIGYQDTFELFFCYFETE